MISEDSLKHAARLLKTSTTRLKTRQLPEDEATYFWVEGRGGAALILGDDQSALYANSSVSPEAHLEAFRSGRRTPLEQFES